MSNDTTIEKEEKSKAPKWSQKDAAKWRKQSSELQKRISATTITAAEHTWDMGKALLDMETAGLWKRVPNEEGTGPLYKSFKDVIEDITPFRRAYGYQLKALASKISREQCVELGLTHAVRLAAAPDEVRQKLLPAAGDMSERELQEAIKEARGEPSNPPAAKAAKLSVGEWTITLSDAGIGQIVVADGKLMLGARVIQTDAGMQVKVGLYAPPAVEDDADEGEGEGEGA